MANWRVRPMGSTTPLRTRRSHHTSVPTDETLVVFTTALRAAAAAVVTASFTLVLCRPRQARHRVSSAPAVN